MEIAIKLNEGPEYWEGAVSGHVIPEASGFSNAIATSTSQLWTMDVVLDRAIA